MKLNNLAFRPEAVIFNAADILADVAIGLFALFMLLVGFDLFPIQITNPVWIVNFASSLCKLMLFPLVGLVLLHISAALAPEIVPLHQRRRFFSRLAAGPWLAICC